MQPQLIRPPSNIDTSFRVNGDPHKYFYNPLHFHPELELTCIIESHGTRFVGDSVENFDAGDLVLVGAYVPHCWKNHPDYFKSDSKLQAIAIVAQFTEDFAGRLFQIPEMTEIKNLFDKAKYGLKITGKTKEEIVRMMLALAELSGFEKVRQLLEILNVLSNSKELTSLSREIHNLRTITEETARLNRVYQFAMNNYLRHISLGEIADIANMSGTAFCRYFKKHTRKTFSNFMNEIRISHACKILTDSDLPVSQVAFDAGFSNISNFIRQFKRVKGIAPLKFRKRYQSINMPPLISSVSPVIKDAC